MSREISSSDNIVSARDIDARIGELESDLQDLIDSVELAQEAIQEHNEGEEPGEEQGEFLLTALSDAQDDLKAWQDEYAAPLAELKEFHSGVSDYGDIAINESYWREYANDQINEAIGNSVQNWPLNCIDWEQARDELQSDYSAVEWEGVTFYVL